MAPRESKQEEMRLKKRKQKKEEEYVRNKDLDRLPERKQEARKQ